MNVGGELQDGSEVRSTNEQVTLIKSILLQVHECTAQMGHATHKKNKNKKIPTITQTFASTVCEITVHVASKMHFLGDKIQVQILLIRLHFITHNS